MPASSLASGLGEAAGAEPGQPDAPPARGGLSYSPGATVNKILGGILGVVPGAGWVCRAGTRQAPIRLSAWPSPTSARAWDVGIGETRGITPKWMRVDCGIGPARGPCLPSAQAGGWVRIFPIMAGWPMIARASASEGRIVWTWKDFDVLGHVK